MPQSTLQCFAPAKINLFLHVTGRRPDGYHTLQTAFLLLDHGDQITLSLRADGQIKRMTDLPGVTPENDLVVRAARLLQDRTGSRQGVDITVNKCLPMGGGLGGGSSDAASVLIGLNKLWQLNIPRAQLQEWALTLGADVPFFIFGQTALAEGVGEALKPLELAEAWFVVVEPPIGVPTAEIFSVENLTRNTKPIIIPRLATPADIMNNSRNDLEQVACERYPAVKEALGALSDFGMARMSGSGACVFLLCESELRAHEVAQEMTKILSWRVWVAKSLNQHPLWSFSQN